MKRVLFFVFAMSALLLSCSDDDIEKGKDYDLNCPPAPKVGMMMDAGEISRLDLYGLQRRVGFDFNIPSVYYYEVKEKGVPVFPNYQSVRLYAWFVTHGKSVSVGDTVKARRIFDLKKDYYRRKTDFILKQYNDQYKNGYYMTWPWLFTSYVDGDVTLTCDKTLFGQEPGQNLSEHVLVFPAYCYVPIGRGENPKTLYFIDDAEKMDSGFRMTDFFQKDTWMQHVYMMKFMEEPEERYDEVTFTITFPAAIEHTYEYIVSMYEGKNEPLQTTEETFKAEYTVKFDWK